MEAIKNKIEDCQKDFKIIKKLEQYIPASMIQEAFTKSTKIISKAQITDQLEIAQLSKFNKKEEAKADVGQAAEMDQKMIEKQQLIQSMGDENDILLKKCNEQANELELIKKDN